MTDWSLLGFGTMAPGPLTISTETASQFLMNMPEQAGKQAHMQQNKRAYEVVIAGGDTLYVEANEVVETATRVKFLGYVPGHSEGSYNNEVVRSFRDVDVESYRLVPVAEEDKRTEGQHVFRINFSDGTSKDVRGDFVTHTPGSEGKNGRYVVATRQKTGNGRTEFVTSDHRVLDIERVPDRDAVKSVPDQADAPSV